MASSSRSRWQRGGANRRWEGWTALFAWALAWPQETESNQWWRRCVSSVHPGPVSGALTATNEAAPNRVCSLVTTIARWCGPSPPIRGASGTGLGGTSPSCGNDRLRGAARSLAQRFMGFNLGTREQPARAMAGAQPAVLGQLVHSFHRYIQNLGRLVHVNLVRVISSIAQEAAAAGHRARVSNLAPGAASVARRRGRARLW